MNEAVFYFKGCKGTLEMENIYIYISLKKLFQIIQVFPGNQLRSSEGPEGLFTISWVCSICSQEFQ